MCRQGDSSYQLEVSPKPAGCYSSICAIWLAWQQQYPVSPRNALRQLLSAARFHAPAHRPPMPLLIPAGARDRLIDHRCAP